MKNDKILGTSKITHKYQITIPKEVRNYYQFEQGDLIVFITEGDKLYIKTNKIP